MNWRETLKMFPVQYRKFGGNVNEDGKEAEYVTDRHIIWRASKAHTERNNRLASNLIDSFTMRVNPDHCRDAFKRKTNKEKRGKLESLNLIEVRRDTHGNYDTAKMQTNSISRVWADAQYLRIMSLLLDFDDLKTDGPEKGIIAYLDNEPVGVIMPLREPKGPEPWEDREVLVSSDDVIR